MTTTPSDQSMRTPKRRSRLKNRSWNVISKTFSRGTVGLAALAALGALGLGSGAAFGQFVDTPIPLNYNFHGMGHTTEAVAGANGPSADIVQYRSISDRGLVWDPANVHAIGTNPLIGATGLPYSLYDFLGYGNCTAANAADNGLDLVHLGNRAFRTFDDATASANGPATNWMPSASISTLVGSGTAVTATTATPHGLAVGNVVCVYGASTTGHNGTFVVASVPDAVTFTYPNTTVAGSSTGTMIVTSLDHTGDQTTVLTSPIPVDNQSEIGVLYTVSDSGGQFDVVLNFSNSTSVACRVSAPDWFGTQTDPVSPGSPVVRQTKVTHTVSGTTYNTFQGVSNTDACRLETFLTTNAGPNLNVIEAVISVNKIIASGNNVAGSQLTSITFRNPLYPPTTCTAITLNGTTATATVGSSAGYLVGQPIQISGVGTTPAVNGLYTIASVPTGTTFTFTSALSGTTTAQIQGNGAQVNSITTTSGVATVTFAAAHGLSVGQKVTITGTSTTGYLGTFVVTSVPTTTTLTFASPTTGTAVAARQVTRVGQNRGYMIYAASVRSGTPVNGSCSTAITANAGLGAAGDNPGNNNHAFDGINTPCGGGNDSGGVWYVYTPAVSGLVEARTCRDGDPSIDSQVRGITGVTTASATDATVILPMDTTLAVYSGSCGSPVLVPNGCNDEGCSVSSRVRWTATAGVPYFIRVAGKNGAVGSFVLHVDNVAHTDLTMPLQYNWNGICHGTTVSTSEQCVTTPIVHENRSDLNGFRGISDRGLLFDPTGNTKNDFNYGGTVGYQGMVYTVYNTALQNDMVHLGTRGQAFSPAGTTWATPATANPSAGLQPLWLAAGYNHNSVSSSMTGLGATFGPGTKIGLLYHMTNVDTATAPYSFTVTLAFSDNSSQDVVVKCTDWYGGTGNPPPYNEVLPAAGAGVESQRVLGIYHAVQNFDRGDDAPSGALKVLEAVISTDSLNAVGFNAPSHGTLSSITFKSIVAANAGANVGIYAATLRDPASFNLNFPPSGVGTVTPNQLPVGSTGKITVSVSRGSGSPNNISSVVVDTSSLFGHAPGTDSLALNDSGANGDVSPNDNIWSRNIFFAASTPSATNVMPFTVTDGQNRTATGNIIFTLVTPTGTLTPAAVNRHGSTKVTINAGTGTSYTSITVDGSPIGLGVIAMNDSGTNGDATANDGIWSRDIVVPINATLGAVTLNYTATDSGSNIINGMVTGTINANTATITPNIGAPGDTIFTSVDLGVNNATPTDVVSVSIDLSPINGGVVAFNDSNLNGDVSLGDGIWSANWVVPASPPAGVATLTYTETDSFGRVQTGTFSFTVNIPPTNDECTTALPIVVGTPVNGTNVGATASVTLTNTGTGSCTQASFAVGAHMDVWYAFVAPATAAYTIDTCGSTMPDTVLSIHSGCPATQSNILDCNDDSTLGTACTSSGVNSRIASVTLTAGQTYYIGVAGYNGGTGAFTAVVNFVNTVGSCCAGPTCTRTDAVNCVSGTYTDGALCSPNPCGAAGICCRGSTCTTTFASAGACSGSLIGGQTAGASFPSGASCNTGGSNTTPCCYADYNKANGISVSDIFDFLADWFAGSPFANTGGNGSPAALQVQNIFDFLSAWFAGGC